MKKYTLGIDYGSLSGRVVLVDITNGNIEASHVVDYPNGVMRSQIPTSPDPLPQDWALQHPGDYLQVLKKAIPAVLGEREVSPEQIIGIGVDFTASTVMPIDEEGIPLCLKKEYTKRPHAWVKLWQHHAAQKEADLINEIADKTGEGFIKRYGGKISSEWMLPKALQILKEDPEIYHKMHRFIEAGDWIVQHLTGKEARNSCAAGYKALWSKKEGYPEKEFLKSLHQDLGEYYKTKVDKRVHSVGTTAGVLTEAAAKEYGLEQGTPVGVANIDAHVAVPAIGAVKDGDMMMIMGTSTCHMLVSNEEHMVPGISGVVEDGILPGMVGYEAGQSCVGGHFEWLLENCIPPSYYKEAEKASKSIHSYLENKAQQLPPGSGGILALDWWNGNRSILNNSELSGVFLGLKLTTKPEQLYRALIEATAFGTKIIIDQFTSSKVFINQLYATGGIATKNKLMMQIYADIINRPIHVSDCEQACALGSAMYGAVAAGEEAGGYKDIYTAAKEMSAKPAVTYYPDQKRHKKYQKAFSLYKEYHDLLGVKYVNLLTSLKKLEE
ncbi:ribulokinase [Wukongibacter baidiensis]|uniref:ribulokinase n=1 Tax=Wukongibacter baidiensis TaxID=1723361 RepID=UPI003D7F8B08